MLSRKAQDIGVFFAILIITVGILMLAESNADVRARSAYFQSAADSEIYYKHNHTKPDYSWYIQAQRHPRKADQSEEAWLTEVGIYQSQWEETHYRSQR